MPKGNLIPRPQRKLSDADRRWLMKAIGVAAVASLPGCQSVLDIGEGVTEGRTGEQYLADIRAENGLGPLTADRTLERAALQQAGYMASSGRMDHDTGWGKDFASRMKDNGVEGAAAENLAHGRMEPGKVFSMWMNSDGHRRNMLDPRFSKFGLAYVREAGGDRKYWALVLGR